MKICFWGDIAGALAGNTSGGGELQLALLAKTLARSGHEVVIIDYNTTEDFITADGIKVFKIKGWNNGIRIIRTFTHRLPQLYWSLKAQKADVYYCRIRDFRHILAFWAARKVKAKFVLGLASDLDAMGFIMRVKHDYLPSKKGPWWFISGLLIEFIQPFIIRNADLVIAQHQGQIDLLKNKCSNYVLFSNFIDPQIIPQKKNIIKKDFVYVGWLDKHKGILDLFTIISESPCQSFKIIGPPRDNTAKKIYLKLSKLDNVTLLGKLNHAETLKHIARSAALISTSPMEGFPNIFLEAWACGIPVLSLHVDPGNIIKTNDLGKVANGKLNLLKSIIKEFNTDNEFSVRAQNYIINNHIVSGDRINNLNYLFLKLFENKSTS